MSLGSEPALSSQHTLLEWRRPEPAAQAVVFRAEFTGPGFLWRIAITWSPFQPFILWSFELSKQDASHPPSVTSQTEAVELKAAVYWERMPGECLVTEVLRAPWCHVAAPVLRGGWGGGLTQVSSTAQGQSGAQGQACGLTHRLLNSDLSDFLPSGLVRVLGFFFLSMKPLSTLHAILWKTGDHEMWIFPFSAPFPPGPFTGWTKSPGLTWRWWIPQRGNFPAGSRCPF